MIQYKQQQLDIIRRKSQYHNIEDHTSDESYQDISMFQKAEKETEAVNAGNRVPSTSSI